MSSDAEESAPKAFNLDQVLTKVRKLTAQAEHIENMSEDDLAQNYPDPEARERFRKEAATFRSVADALMLKYAIDQAMISDAAPAAEKMIPAFAEFAIAAPGSLLSHVDDLMRVIASHCRCMVRSYTRLDKESGAWMAKVYGYKHDLAYFEILWTTLRLHMIGAFRPVIDPSASLSENCYRLHNAGFNLLEIVKMYGWVDVSPYDSHVEAWAATHPGFDPWAERKKWFYNRDTGEVSDLHPLKVFYSRAYRNECKRRGEDYRPSAAGGSESYREDAAAGYVSIIRQRIRQIEGGRADIGSALVLSSEGLLDYYREQNPGAFTRCPHCSKLSASQYTCDRCKEEIAPRPAAPAPCKRCAAAKSGYCRDHRPLRYNYRKLNDAGYSAGAAHARTADLTGNKVGGTKKQIT